MNTFPTGRKNPQVRMRKDLAHARISVAGYDSIDEPDTGIGITWLTSRELMGAVQLPDRCTDCPEYNFNRIRLVDGRVFFMVGADLDWIEHDPLP